MAFKEIDLKKVKVFLGQNAYELKRNIYVFLASEKTTHQKNARNQESVELLVVIKHTTDCCIRKGRNKSVQRNLKTLRT